MRKTSTILCAFIVGSVLHHAAYAEDNALRAILHVDGYGRKVEVRVNGKVLPGVTGGSSQTVQLFHVNSPNKAEFAEEMKNLLCLQSGTNAIHVVYAPKEGETPREMEITIRGVTLTTEGWAKPSETPLFEKKIEKEEKAGTFTASFTPAGKAAEKNPK
jgi:hypothetical protein